MKQHIREEIEKLRNKIVRNGTSGPTAATWERVAALATILKDLEEADYYRDKPLS